MGYLSVKSWLASRVSLFCCFVLCHNSCSATIVVVVAVVQFVVAFVVLPVVIAYVKIMLFHFETTSHRMCPCPCPCPCHADIACPTAGEHWWWGGRELTWVGHLREMP